MERLRLERLAAAEAEGQEFWTDELDQPTRFKIAYLLGRAAEIIAESSRYPNKVRAEEVWRQISVSIAMKAGIDVPPLSVGYLKSCQDTPLILTCIEAFALQKTAPNSATLAEHLPQVINPILDSHRINFQLTETGRIIPRSSQELHLETVLKPLQLLHGRPDLDRAQDSYLAALSELSDGKPADAITDAATALQFALTALGHSGKTLGDQFKNLRKSGWLAGRDAKLTESFEKLQDWITGERNQNSDVHPSEGTSIDDAWFMVHIVGAFIVRLVGEPRA